MGDITNIIDDSYPCSRCSVNTRAYCCGCQKLSDWMDKIKNIKEHEVELAKEGAPERDVELAIYELKRKFVQGSCYGKHEHELLDNMTRILHQYFRDTEKNGWWDIVNGHVYPDPFTPVLVTVRDDTGDNIPYTYTDVASYTGVPDGFWIAKDEPIRGTVIAWMLFPKPAEVR